MASPSYAPGAHVRISGISARPELNGTTGTVEELLENGRVRVRQDGSRAILSLKHGNISLILDPEQVDDECGFSTPTNMHIWTTFQFFYPFGNTPARLLTRQFPPHLATCRILLLGCGDPRHVLFTAWSHSLSSSYRTIQLDVTMCDMDSSILARNLVLFKLVLDKAVSAARMWCIFYSQRIDEACMLDLQQCAQSLLDIGDTLSSWHASPVGAILKFTDARSFASIRAILHLYTKPPLSQMEEAEKLAYRNKLDPVFTNTKNTSLNTFAPAIYANESALLALAKAYKELGTAPSCIYESTPSQRLCFNPMALQGLDQHITTHYGLDPTMGFHRSLAYIDTLHGPLHSEIRGVTDDQQRIYSSCFQQFREWTTAFRTLASEGSVVVRMHSGDALGLCDILSSNKSIYRPSRTLQKTMILSDVPRLFDVIDTSNVSDSCGLLNMLCSCSPLLESSHGLLSMSVMSTSGPESGGLLAFLEYVLQVPLSTFSALTNLQLIDSYNGLTTHFGDYFDGNIQRAAFSSAGVNCGNCHPRYLDWKIACPLALKSSIRLSNTEFIHMYLCWYRRIFAPIYSADAYALFSHQSLEGQNKFAVPTFQTFSRLVAWGASNVSGIDRTCVFEDLIDTLHQESRLVIQGNVSLCIHAWFYRLGLIGDQVFKLSSLTTEQGVVALRKPIATPNFALVTLLVPRQRIEMLQSSTVLLMSCTSPHHGTIFDSFHMCRVKSVLSNSKTSSSTSQQSFTLCDTDGGDFIYVAYSVIVPSLALIPADTRVALTISPSTIRKYIELFGISLTVFDAFISDTQHVSVDYQFDESIIKFTAPSSNATSRDEDCTAVLSSEGSISGVDYSIAYPHERENDSLVPSVVDMPIPLGFELVLGRFVAKRFPPATADLTCPILQLDRKRIVAKVSLLLGKRTPPKRLFSVFPCLQTSRKTACR